MQTANETVIRTEKLTKSYASPNMIGGVLTVLNELDLEVFQGEIFGFLGPNGAGKTTTIKLLLGLIFPTSGTAEIYGKPADDLAVKHKISFMPDQPHYYDFLSGYEVLKFYASLFKLTGKAAESKIDELLELVSMKDASKRRLREYSRGMLQRIGLAQALLNDPGLLIMDEPTNGLDPVAQRQMRDLIIELKNRGKTVFLSSHSLYDIEIIADRVALLDKGNLVKVGRTRELLSRKELELTAELPNEEAVQAIRALAPDTRQTGLTVILRTANEELIAQAIELVHQHKGRLISVVPLQQSLEELFMETVGKGGGR
ncbi:MAG TPA: ABC transporter ATP-binding protein [Armatimonadota bacterium]|nr:ABC transporter ATP-binding protein [Armatimonadota bacterium]